MPSIRLALAGAVLPPLCCVLPVLVLPAVPAAAAGGMAATAMNHALLGSLAASTLLLSGLLGWSVLWLRRRLREQAERNAQLAVRNAALRETADRAEARARMLDGAMAALSDGVAVVDGDLRIVGWNSRFAEVTGVPREALRIGLPFEEAVRLQAQSGEFGVVDPEAETARRMRLLQAGRQVGRWQRERPDGSRIELRRVPMPGGGFVTLYTPVAEAESYPPAEVEEAFRTEWRARLPRLTAAAADGDAAGTRQAAHALRGIAANAGWRGAAGVLAAIETAAGTGDLKEVRALATMLLLDEPW